MALQWRRLSSRIRFSTRRSRNRRGISDSMMTESPRTDHRDERRTSSYFVPIAQPKKKPRQLAFETEWTARSDRGERAGQPDPGTGGAVAAGWLPGRDADDGATARVLDRSRSGNGSCSSARSRRWKRRSTSPRWRHKYGDAWIENDLREANDYSNPGLPRIALKMATGSGKTVVMAMLIAWQALNKLREPAGRPLLRTFLIVTPGITIRDRLRVLLPSDPDNYYRQRDIVPPSDLRALGQAKIVITNYHAFQLREKVAGAAS